MSMTNTDYLTGAHTGLGKAAKGRDNAPERYATGAGISGDCFACIFHLVHRECMRFCGLASLRQTIITDRPEDVIRDVLRSRMLC